MQITEHVHAIRIPFQLRDGSGLTVDRFVYAYLVYGRQISLVDTGVASSAETIFAYLRKTGREPGEISRIVLTHAHADHVGAARSIKEATGAAVMIHSADRAWLEDPDLQYKERPVPGFFSLVGASVRADRVLEDGDTVDLGDGLELAVIHTPGHSNGSLSFFLPEDGALFCGDALPVPGDMPVYDDVPASVRSIKKLKNLAGVRFLLSSWADPQEGERAYRAMDEGLHYLQTVHEAVRKAAGDFPPPMAELLRPVVAVLGLPAQAANPLVSRSLEAHLRILEHRDLLAE